MTRRDNTNARHELRTRGLDCRSPLLRQILFTIKLAKQVGIGDKRKSWDVLEASRIIEENIHSADPILDIGSYRSEILPVLHRLGYANLWGLDLDPKIGKMPLSPHINYQVGDYRQTSYADGYFAAVTAISVIEHGYDGNRLFREISRILRPGGYFVASVDYWPEKIETRGIQVFDEDWAIFSREEVEGLLTLASQYHLGPCGDVDLKSGDRTVSWCGKEYTFALIVLRKEDRPGLI